jgi:hypothetical protein
MNQSNTQPNPLRGEARPGRTVVDPACWTAALAANQKKLSR